MAGVALPIGTTVRARGYVASSGRGEGIVERTVTVTPDRPPVILTEDGGFGHTGDGFGFTIGGMIGQQLVVEGSHDLRLWQPLLTNTLGQDHFFYRDPDSIVEPRRFYRLRLVP